MTTLESLDGALAQWAAEFAGLRPPLPGLLVAWTESDLAKALLLAPWLLVIWFEAGATPARRAAVFGTIVSCATALACVWCFTTVWPRPRPLVPAAGLPVVASVFLPHFASPPDTYWGCFPSDHIAYLAALAFGVRRLARGAGAFAWVFVIVQAIARVAVGLHYLSDVVAALVFAWVVDWAVFFGLRLPKRAWVTWSVAVVARSRWLQAGLVLVVVEMATLFREVRFFDDLIFGH